MGRRIPEPDAAEAGGLRPDPRRGPAAARQGAQRAGAGRHRCGFFFLVILYCTAVPTRCVSCSCTVWAFVVFRCWLFLRGFSEFWSARWLCRGICQVQFTCHNFLHYRYRNWTYFFLPFMISPVSKLYGVCSYPFHTTDSKKLYRGDIKRFL
jgi:hypothetical protein